MLKSMTGYGKAVGVVMGKNVSVEIKSLNHRYAEIFCRLPMEIYPCEQEIRKTITAKITRGKVEISLKMDATTPKTMPALNEEMAKGYYAMLVRLNDMLGIAGEVQLADVTSFRNIFTQQEEEAGSEEMFPEVMAIIDEAIASLIKMKIVEGNNLRDDIRGRLGVIKDVIGEIESRVPVCLQEYHQRLSRRVKELVAGVDIDEARLAQEVAIIAEKSDIAEEITRLNSHIEQMEEMLENIEQEAIGRKTDFLLQEMGREVNTIGSKSGDVEIARAVISLKSELSKIREQAQNIE